MRLSPPIIGILVAVLLTAGFWFLLYKPADERQTAVEAEIATLEQQQSSLRNEIAQLRDVQDREVEIRAAQARLEQYIPIGAAQPSAIRQLQGAADQAGADVTSITFAEPTVPQAAEGAAPTDTGTPGTVLANIPVTMVVEGGYFQVVDFFRRLEVEVPRAVLVQNLDISESTAGFPRLQTTWAGQLFAVIEGSDLVDTTTGGPAPGATPTPTPSPTPAGGES